MARQRKEEAPFGFEMKCTVCEATKDASLFVTDRRRPNGKVNECKDCRRERNNRKGYSSNRTTGAYNRQLVLEAKSVPCMDCGNTYPAYVMDLDHVRGEKKFVLSQCYSQTTEDVIEELKKCEAVCSNCHRIRTFTRS